MSDQQVDNKSIEDKLVSEPVSESKRRLAKSGLMGGAVLMALSGRSAFATGGGFTQNCSVDTLFSVYNGGSQYDFDVSQCEYGCTPGFWNGGGASYAWNKVAQLSGGWSLSTPIESVFSSILGDDSSLDDANKLKGKTIGDVISTPNEGEAFVKQYVRHGMAAILNSMMMGFYYTGQYDSQSIVEWFNIAWANYLLDPNNASYQNELSSIHQTFKDFNERNCPLGAGNSKSASSNPFFDDDFRQNITFY